MAPKIYFLLGIAAAPIGLVLLHFFKKMFLQLGVVDRPGQGKVHTEPKVTMLGIPMYIAAGIVFITYIFVSSQNSINYFALFYFVGLTLCFLLGVVDDIFHIRALMKVIPLLAISLFASLYVSRVSVISIPFWGVFVLPESTAVIITTMWFFIVISAVNIIDGIDGLLGSFAISYFSACLIIALMTGSSATIFYALFSVSIVSVYMLYNFPPAEVFMGNSGSHLIAYLVATVPFVERGFGNSLINVAPYLVMLTYPLIDISISLLRRFLGKVNVFSRDIHHIHHMLVRSFGDERKTLKFFIGLFSTNAFMAVTLVIMNHTLRVLSFFAYVILNVAFSLFFAIRYSPGRKSTGENSARE